VVTGHAQNFGGKKLGGWKMAMAFCCRFDRSDRRGVATQVSVEDLDVGKGKVVEHAGVGSGSVGLVVPEMRIGIAVAGDVGDVGVGRGDVEAAYSALVEDTHTLVVLDGMRGRFARSPHLDLQASSATSSR
jgi:hypothetical protein